MRADAGTTLPPVSGEIKVAIAEGMEATVDAAAYMAELRSEVEGLRKQLAITKQSKQEGSLMEYLGALKPGDQRELTSEVRARNALAVCVRLHRSPHVLLGI
jgi:hypothetical protein